MVDVVDDGGWVNDEIKSTSRRALEDVARRRALASVGVEFTPDEPRVAEIVARAERHDASRGMTMTIASFIGRYVRLRRIMDDDVETTSLDANRGRETRRGRR